MRVFLEEVEKAVSNEYGLEVGTTVQIAREWVRK
jgi:hypothetical protein